MSKIEKDILSIAYKQFSNSYERVFVVKPANVDETVSYINVLSSLVKDGYLICNSDNLNQSTYQLAPKYELVFEMELTDSGIDYIRQYINL